MKDLLPVLRVLGMLMIMFAGAMLLPFWHLLVHFADGIWRIYPWSIGLTGWRGPVAVGACNATSRICNRVMA